MAKNNKYTHMVHLQAAAILGLMSSVITIAYASSAYAFSM
jgi:uncharacterized protein YraI